MPRQHGGLGEGGTREGILTCSFGCPGSRWMARVCEPPLLCRPFCRIVPRHRYFLQVHAQRGQRAASGGSGGAGSSSSSVVGAGEVAFPMGLLKCSDVQFAKLCGTSLEEYEAFRAKLFGGAASAASGSSSTSSSSTDA